MVSRNVSEPLTPDRVKPLLRGRLGRPYLWSETSPSTQEVLRDAALPEGAVAVTEHQTAGRGRAGRQWQDAPGTALLLSVLLRPQDTAGAPQLSLLSALAVAESVEATTGLEAAVKWPNDVLVGGRKVAGILLEGHEGAVVCGIGINVSQTEETLPRDARLPPASLLTLTGRETDRAALLVLVLERLERLYDTWLEEGLAPLLPELGRRDALHGQGVQVGDLDGVGAGIALDGRLRLLRPDGTTALIASGEVNASL